VFGNVQGASSVREIHRFQPLPTKAGTVGERAAGLTRESLFDLVPHFIEIRSERWVHTGVIILIGISAVTYGLKRLQFVQGQIVQSAHYRFLYPSWWTLYFECGRSNKARCLGSLPLYSP
jgi:hypothetical protein